MSEPIDELVLKISADVAGLKADLASVAVSSQELANKVKGHGESMFASFFKAEVAIEACKLALEKLKEITVEEVKGVMEHVEAQDRLAQKLNVTYGFLAALNEQGEQFGITSEEMGNAILKLQRSLGQIKDGTEPAAKALDKLKLNYEDVLNLKPEEQYKVIAEAFSHLTNQTDRAAVATGLYGREGIQLISVLRQGAAGFEEAAEKAKKLGLALTPEDVATIRQANAAWREVHQAIEGLATTLTVKLSPFLVGIAEEINSAVEQGDQFGDVVGDAIMFVARTLDGLRLELDAIELIFKGLGTLIVGSFAAAFTVLDTLIRAQFVFPMQLGYNIIKTLIQTAPQMVGHIGDIFKLLGAEIGKFFLDRANDIGGLLDNIGNAMASAGVKGSEAFLGASRLIYQSTNNANVAMQQTINDTKKALGPLGDAWAKVVPKWEDTAIPGLTKLAETARAAAITIGQSFATQLNTPVSLTSIEDWAAKVIKKVKEVSIKIAEVRNQDAAEEQHVNLQKQRWEEQTWDQKLGYATSTMNSLGELMENGSRRQFEIGKKLQLAAAIADTAAGVAKTFQQFGWYALLGPAEAVAAAGAVQIAKISQMHYGGGGGGGGGAGVSSAAAAPSAANGTVNPGPSGQTVKIAMQGHLFNEQSLRSLVGQLNELARNGVPIIGVETT